MQDPVQLTTSDVRVAVTAESEEGAQWLADCAASFGAASRRMGLRVALYGMAPSVVSAMERSRRMGHLQVQEFERAYAEVDHQIDVTHAVLEITEDEDAVDGRNVLSREDMP